MCKVAIFGAGGRMGQANVLAAHQDKEIDLVGAIEAPGTSYIGQDAGILAGCGQININITADFNEILSKTDLVIDFTSPKSTLAALYENRSSKKAFVIGTTGLADEEKAKLQEFAKEAPIVFAPNYSIGVNVLLKLTEIASSFLNKDRGYDLEIIEAHHRFKKDSPSGTALRLAELAAEHSGRDLKKDAIYGRQGITEERSIDEIGMLTMRAGDIIGEHKLVLATLGERVELGHIAHNRATFTKGVILAAKWIKGRQPGLYSMKDVLDL